jgi:hypothetical protein
MIEWTTTKLNIDSAGGGEQSLEAGGRRKEEEGRRKKGTKMGETSTYRE